MLYLQNAYFIMNISPQLGGRILALKSVPYGCDILHPAELSPNRQVSADNPAIKGGSYPLVPYSNRICNAHFTWDNKRHTLPVSPIAVPHAIHGVGWYNSWAIQSQSDTMVTICYTHTKNTDWDFDFTTIQTFKLCNNTIKNTIKIINTDTQNQPVGLGLHPFFNAKNLQTLHMPAMDMWVLKNGIPQHTTPIPDIYNFNIPKPFINPIDDIFNGVTQGCIAQYDTYTMQVTTDTPYAVVYSNNPTEFFCFEPVSHVHNALNRHSPEKHGIKILSPTQTHAISMTIAIE